MPTNPTEQKYCMACGAELEPRWHLSRCGLKKCAEDLKDLCPSKAPVSAVQCLRMIEPFHTEAHVTAEIFFGKLGTPGIVIIQADTDEDPADVTLTPREAYDLMLWLQSALSHAPDPDLLPRFERAGPLIKYEMPVDPDIIPPRHWEVIAGPGVETTGRPPYNVRMLVWYRDGTDWWISKLVPSGDGRGRWTTGKGHCDFDKVIAWRLFPTSPERRESARR